MKGIEDDNISGLIRGDEEQFRRLFTDYYPSLLSFSVKYVENRDVAEDIVQDVFVRLWENRSELGEVTNLSAYLYQMVRNRSLNHLRAEKVRKDVSKKFHEEPMQEMNHYVREETVRWVMHFLDQLPPACRNIFSRFLQGYSAKEIAEELHIAVETVKKQKQIARRILQGKLDSFLGCFWFLINRSKKIIKKNT